MKHSAPYRLGCAQLTRLDDVVQDVGPGAQCGYPTGEIKTELGAGRAELWIPVSGPRGEGTGVVTATQSGGVWRVTHVSWHDPGGESLAHLN